MRNSLALSTTLSTTLSTSLSTLMLGLFVSPAIALAQGKFEVVEKDGQSCLVGSEVKTQTCYPTVAVTLNRSPDELRIVSQIKALAEFEKSNVAQLGYTLTSADLSRFSTALFIAPKDRAVILKHFSEISVRHLAIDPKWLPMTNANEIKVNDLSKLKLPFMAKIPWRGYLGGATLHVRGVAILDLNEMAKSMSLKLTKENIESMRTGLTKALSDESLVYADGTTGLKWESLRWMERLSRYAQFKVMAVYGDASGDVDQQTRHLLTQVVAPAVVGEVFVVPLIRFMRSLPGADSIETPNSPPKS